MTPYSLVFHTVFALGLVSHSQTIKLQPVINYLSNILFCNHYFLPSNISDDLEEVSLRIYGQPFVGLYLIPYLKYHFLIDKLRAIQPSKPLVLRFYGPVGVGKTLVAERLSKMSYFRNKHFISSKADFHLKDGASLLIHKKELKDKIESSIRACKRSVFVFDDVHLMPEGFYEDLPPFRRDSNLNFNESLFIYISQEHSEAIFSAATTLKQTGKKRIEFNIDEFLTTLNQITSGSFFKSFGNNVKSSPNVVDLYFPFLPLEPVHVMACIQLAIEAINIRPSKKVLENVLSSVDCIPGNEFCPHGCKRVHSQLYITLGRHDEL